MRIGIDARFYGSAAKGLGRYTSELITHLERIHDGHEYVVFLRADNFDAYAPKDPRFTKVLADFPWYGWREQLLFPRLLRKHNLDLVHFPHFNVPMLYRGPFMCTIHDLILLSHPSKRATTLGPLLFWIKFAAYKAVISHAIRKAVAVLAVSEYTRTDVLAHYPGIAPDRVIATPLAVSPAFRAEAAPLRSDIREPYALYVGNAYPHKNLETLVRAFAAFRAGSHAGWHLVLVGAKDYFYERLQREAAENGTATNITFFGEATDAELAALYDHAAFYVFPSLHEGFGLPPLEAAQRGIAVASSDATCLPETLGDAARYFSPTDPAAMAAAMADLADDAALRAQLVERGRANLTRFDWQRTADRTHQAYLDALTSR